eukprot:1153150-Pelagomonas_calceolata.AAC.2
MGFQATLTWCVAGPFARAWMRNWPKYPEPPTISTFIAGMKGIKGKPEERADQKYLVYLSVVCATHPTEVSTMYGSLKGVIKEQQQHWQSTPLSVCDGEIGSLLLTSRKLNTYSNNECPAAEQELCSEQGGRAGTCSCSLTPLYPPAPPASAPAHAPHSPHAHHSQAKSTKKGAKAVSITLVLSALAHAHPSPVQQQRHAAAAAATAALAADVL